MKRSNSGFYPFRSKLNADKVVGFYLSHSSAKEYRGVLENYIRWSMSTLKSEGKQAENRLKSYKEYFHSQLSLGSVKYPERGKYKKLLPILKILDKFLQSNDLQGIRMLNTVMRLSELARPSQRYLNKALIDYISRIGSDVTVLTENDAKRFNGPITAEPALNIVAREQAQYPDFPWQEFRNWLKSQEEIARALVVMTRPHPHLSASLLVKSSSSKIKVGEGKNRVYKSVPAICLADIEQSLIELNTDSDHKNVVRSFAEALLKSLEYSESYHVEDTAPTYVKDKEAFLQFVDDNFLFYRMSAVVIEASSGIKERIVIKGNYAYQYPLQMLHESALAVAQMFPGDFSGDHDAGFKSLNEYAGTADYLADVDATAWTDYFPLCFQYEVVKTFYGPEVASTWVQLMRAPIHAELVYHDGTKLTITFRMHMGQPMGLYSSWAVAHLSHHMLVRFSASRAGSATLIPSKDGKPLIYSWRNKQFFLAAFRRPYWLVGDDEVSADPATQTVYMALESSLGIVLNPDKSKVLSRENHKGLAEFVHRQTYYGSEVTGISPKLICNSFKDYSSLAGFLSFIRSRSFPLSESMLISDLVKEIDTLSRHQYHSKYGVYPIPRRQIDLGLKFPSCLGGLIPDNSNWNTKVDPYITMSAMLLRISSILNFYRPGSPRLRDGRLNADEILNAMCLQPDSSIVNVTNSALAKYERRVFEDKTNLAFLREVGTSLSSYLTTFHRTFSLASLSDFRYIDMEVFKEWILRTIANLKSTAAIPSYLAREFEARVTRQTITGLYKLDPYRCPSLDDWRIRIERKYQSIESQLSHLSSSIFPKKQMAKEDILGFYETLWSDSFDG